MQVDIFLLLSLLILSVLFLLELTTNCPARHTRRSVGVSHSRTQR
jgi:hypothetical protein